MRTIPLCLLTSVLFPTGAIAQRLVAYDPALPMHAEYQPPTPVLPAALPPVLMYPQAPALPVLPPAPPLYPGDSTFDNVTGLHWYTNGAMIALQPTPSFPPAGPLFAPFPIPAAVLAPLGGMVTGMAIDPLGGVLWLAGMPGIVLGVAPVPALPIVVPPFPLLFPTGPLSGLEWDGSTGALYAVDVAGVVYPFLPGGAPLGPPILPTVPAPLPAGDVAIDKTLRLNAVGLRPLYVVSGGMIYDTNDPFAVPMPPFSPLPLGLAFLDHPATQMPGGSCACPGGATPVNFTTGPMASGNAAFAVGMTGLGPFGIGVFGFDTVFNPLFPTVNLVGCPLGLIPGSPGIILGVALADAFGTATLPLPLLYPVGAGPLQNQNFTFCTSDPLGLVFAPMQTIYAAGF